VKTNILIILSAAALMSSCIARPTLYATNPDTGEKTVLSLGVSVLSNSKAVRARATHNGVTLEYSADGEDSGSVASNYIGSKLALGLAENLTSRLKSADGVKRVTETYKGEALVKGTKDPNIIPLDPNVIPETPAPVAP
jgi:hypothetical protein